VPLGIRGKLFAISLALIGLAALTSGVLLETVMRTLLVERLTDELTRIAEVTAQAVALVKEPLTAGSQQPLVRRLAAAGHARVTLLASSGVVLADSALSGEELASAENHGDRPELRQAAASGLGVATRFSETVGTEMMYVAVPMRGAASGTVRVAMSLAEVDALIAHMRFLITGAVLLGLVIAAGMGALASYLAARSLLSLVTRARALATGAPGERLSLPDSDELGGLAGSFNTMAEELERTMRALGDERDRVHAILESLTDGVLALDAQAQLSAINGAALTLLGVSQVAPGTPLIELMRVPELLAVVARAQAGHTAHAEFVWPGAVRRTLLATAGPQRALGSAVVVLRDVTELRRLETMRRDFVANVSHELRTPVSIISANVETLVRGALHDPQRAAEFLGAVQRNAERLARLVHELLDLSRIEAGSIQLEPKPMTAEAAVGAVIDLLETRAHAKGLAFELAVEDDLCFVGDARSLEQVLVNLVDNAIKYTPAPGSVLIAIRRDGSDALIEVADSGPGVPVSHRARLFERFYRVDPGRSRDMGGTGLGLSIVKHLVELMRGTVGMRPNSPSGSVFWLRLPLASEPRAAAGERSDAGDRGSP
jgi:two-component system phosphate regulon sensor histidine kinase PhoR